MIKNALTNSSICKTDSTATLTSTTNKLSFINLSIGIGSNTNPLHGIIRPSALISESIGSNQDAVRAITLPVFPRSLVLRPIRPTEKTPAIGIVLPPFTVVDGSIWQCVYSQSVTEILLEIADVLASFFLIVYDIVVIVTTFTLHPSLLPITLIDNSFPVW